MLMAMGILITGSIVLAGPFHLVDYSCFLDHLNSPFWLESLVATQQPRVTALHISLPHPQPPPLRYPHHPMTLPGCRQARPFRRHVYIPPYPPSRPILFSSHKNFSDFE